MPSAVVDGAPEDPSATVSLPGSAALRDRGRDLVEDVARFRDDAEDLLGPVTGLLNNMAIWAPQEGGVVDADGFRCGGRIGSDVERRRQLMTLNVRRMHLYLSMATTAAREIHLHANEVHLASSGSFDEDE